MDQKTSNIEQEDQHCAYAVQLLTSASLPFVLNATIELQVFEIIAKAGPNAQLSAAQIASQLPTNNEEAASMLDRMLRLLACYSVLTCSLNKKDGDEKSDYGVERFYGLTPVGKFFVRNKDGASMGPLCALLQDKVFIESWFGLKDSVLEGGIPFNRAHGIHAFEYPSKDARFNEVFNDAMLNHSSIIMGNILNSYKGFDNLKTLVDVGGGLGINLKMITSKYPTLKGINFDLPHVIKKAPSYPGVDHVGGDMFETVPQGDAVFMKWILHDWSDEHCLKLLKNCYKSTPKDGKIIVAEYLYPENPDSNASVISTSETDVLMMTQNPGGKERSEKEFLALAKGAGFKGIRLDSFVCNFWVIEFYKRFISATSKNNIESPLVNEAHLVEQEEQHCAYAIQLLTSAALPFVLNATIELQVFEIIAKAGPNAQLSAAQIASQLPTNNPEAAAMLDRMLRLLACYSVLTCSSNKKDGDEKNDYGVERFYGLTPVGKFFVRNKDGASMGPLCALLQDKVIIQSWFGLKDCVLEGGIPFDRTHGTQLFQYSSKDPRFNEVFNNAMLDKLSIIMGNILNSYKGFDNLKTLVDVGGGLGINLKMITSKYPTLKGINYDLSHVIEKAPSYPGVDHVGGDMFETVPGRDAIFMKWVLHDWSDDHCLKLLKNCYKSLPEDGKVIVAEYLYPEKPDSSPSVISISEFDVLMMSQVPGGKERSENEFLALAKGAGFKGIRLDSFVCNFWVMEFYK